MYLKSLELIGFKSFGKKAYLEFNSPISAIVGPNGSGKSNIAEAFRFVLGEQSIKSMRGKKGEDLIFNGGKTLSRSNRAAVKVVFDNKDRMLNIDFDEVVIERAVLRDGINEYKINGSDVRLKDITELLFSAHIGSSGHHIISQGEADRMLSASNKERKEILEEALGLKVYQHKKEEGKRKLDKTEANMKETESIIRELAPHLRFLKKQYEKIEKSVLIRSELLEISKNYLMNESFYLENKKVVLNNEKSDLNTKLENLAIEETNLLKIVDQAKEKIKESNNQEDARVKILEDELSSRISSKEECSREIGKIDGETNYILRNIKKQEDDLLKERTKTILFYEVEDLYKRLLTLGSLEEVIKTVDEFIGKHKTHTEENDLVSELRNELKNLEDKKNTLTVELNKKIEEERGARSKLESLRQEIQKEKQISFESEKDLLILRANKRELSQKLFGINESEKMLEEESLIYKTDLEELGFLLGREVLDFGAGEAADRHVQHDIRRQIEKLKIRLEEAGVANTGDITKEYKDTEERDVFLKKELSDLQESKKTLEDMISELESKIEVEFKLGVKKINDEFNDFFNVMFGGGRASLEILKEQDEEGYVNECVDIAVELPHKKTKGLMMLSGGERALTSIALLFAMSRVNPPPFIILDETDAALDEANSKKYGDMIERLASHSELILITHNRETMSRAGVIYGVTMSGDGSSKLLSIQFEEAVQVAK